MRRTVAASTDSHGSSWAVLPRGGVFEDGLACQSAPYRLGGVSEPVQQEFASIGDQAREALNEVRGMLGVLRSDGQLAEQLPRPGTVQIDALMQGTRAAGVDLEWSVEGDGCSCSDTSGMVVFRILQESLANASRHAPGAPVLVLAYETGVVTPR